MEIHPTPILPTALHNTKSRSPRDESCWSLLSFCDPHQYLSEQQESDGKENQTSGQPLPGNEEWHFADLLSDMQASSSAEKLGQQQDDSNALNQGQQQGTTRNDDDPPPQQQNVMVAPQLEHWDGDTEQGLSNIPPPHVGDDAAFSSASSAVLPPEQFLLPRSTPSAFGQSLLLPPPPSQQQQASATAASPVPATSVEADLSTLLEPTPLKEDRMVPTAAPVASSLFPPPPTSIAAPPIPGMVELNNLQQQQYAMSSTPALHQQRLLSQMGPSSGAGQPQQQHPPSLSFPTTAALLAQNQLSQQQHASSQFHNLSAMPSWAGAGNQSLLPQQQSSSSSASMILPGASLHQQQQVTAMSSNMQDAGALNMLALSQQQQQQPPTLLGTSGLAGLLDGTTTTQGAVPSNFAGLTPRLPTVQQLMGSTTATSSTQQPGLSLNTAGDAKVPSRFASQMVGDASTTTSQHQQATAAANALGMLGLPSNLSQENAATLIQQLGGAAGAWQGPINKDSVPPKEQKESSSTMSSLLSREPQQQQPQRPIAVAAAARKASDDESEEGSRTYQGKPKRMYRHESFPEKLFRLLVDLEKEDKADIASFVRDGNGFHIHRPEAFEKEILAKYFRHGKIASFQRQLGLYGFTRVKGKRGKRGIVMYIHPMFQRNKPDQCKQMQRIDY